jgi:hypothetical protein
VRVLAQLSRRCFLIRPNQDALHNTIVSASLVHLVMRRIVWWNSCHVMMTMFPSQFPQDFYSPSAFAPLFVLPSLFVPFEQAELLGVRT